MGRRTKQDEASKKSIHGASGEASIAAADLDEGAGDVEAVANTVGIGDDGHGDEAIDLELAEAREIDQADEQAARDAAANRQAIIEAIEKRIAEIGQPRDVLREVREAREAFAQKKARVLAELDQEQARVDADFARVEREKFHPLVAELDQLKARLRGLK